MSEQTLSVREIQESDITHIIRYWSTADSAYLRAMGADKTMLPAPEEWTQMLKAQLLAPLPEKKSYCLIWLLNGSPVGHCNTNKIIFGQEAYMHLHMWSSEGRNAGLGAQFVRLCLPWFFEKLQLKTLFCEPYALNPAPNHTLAKIGFRFVKEYVTVPGAINFEQLVKLWAMTLEEFKALPPAPSVSTL